MNFLPFEDVFKDESGGNIKTLKTEFLEEGKVPIVDQGKALIAGFTDDERRIYKSELPVIIFGDHTRCFKFVDFPFAMGADGVKVLKPKIKADEKFLFYYLKSLNLPDAGYDRHFKYLKRTEILMPPLPEQKRIAEVLDKADALREKRRLALQKLDTLLQSVFFEMFGDPLNPTDKSNFFKLSEIAEINMGQSPKGDSYNLLGKGTPLLNGPTEFGVKYPTTKQWTTSPTKLCKTGDILFCVRGATAGRLNFADSEYCIGRGLAAIRPLSNSYASLEFIYFVLERYYSYFQQKGVGSTFINISGEELKKVLIPKATANEVVEFKKIYQVITKLKEHFAKGLNHSQNLFQSLQQRAFKGELFNGEFPPVEPQEENVWQQTSLF